MAAPQYPPQVFQSIDADKWERIKALITKQTGIPVTADVGQDSKAGVTLSWNWNAGLKTLTTTLVKREFFDPSAETIEGDIKNLVAQA